MNDFLRLASSRRVVRRSLLYAAVVGPTLIVINHAEALARGEVNLVRVLKMALTMAVPYLVSTFSSVQALRQDRKTPGIPRPE